MNLLYLPILDNVKLLNKTGNTQAVIGCWFSVQVHFKCTQYSLHVTTEQHVQHL